VVEVWRRPEHAIVTGGTVVLRWPSLALVDAAGQQLEVGPHLSGQAELIRVALGAVVPRRRARFEDVLAGGGRVDFGPLALSARGMETEGGRRRLARADVGDVSRSGEGIRVRARARSGPGSRGSCPARTS
jgi:hypothetical protein